MEIGCFDREHLSFVFYELLAVQLTQLGLSVLPNHEIELQHAQIAAPPDQLFLVVTDFRGPLSEMFLDHAVVSVLYKCLEVSPGAEPAPRSC